MEDSQEMEMQYIPEDIISEFTEHIDLADHEESATSGISNPSYPNRNQETMQYTLGQPPRQPVNPYTNENKNLRTIGKRLPNETSFFKNNSVILNVTECHPQLLDTYLEQWTAAIARDYAARHTNINSGEEMIRIAENYLGDIAKAIWEAYKQNFPEQMNELIMQGSNIYNFAYTMHRIITGREVNTGVTIRQQEAMRDLEQIQLLDWKYIIKFLKEFLHYATISGNYYSAEIGNRLFSKLPGDLGKEIHKSWIEGYENNSHNIPKGYDNIGIRITHIISELKKKCTYIQIQRELKQKNYGFCGQIYTPQQYGSRNYNIDRKPKFKKNYAKKYYLRRSNAKKPYLNKERHVRKYNPRKTYTNTITCFACNEKGHLSSSCPKKHNLFTRESNLVDSVKEDLLEIASDVSETSTIYSIISLEGLEEQENIQTSNYTLINELTEFQENMPQEYLLNIVNKDLCQHEFKHKMGTDTTKCEFCPWYPAFDKRFKCIECIIEICHVCAKSKFNIELPKENKFVYTDKNKINEERIKILEDRINNLELDIEEIKINIPTLIQDKEKTINLNESTSITENEIDKNLNNIDKSIQIPLMCNTENLKELRVPTKLNIKGIEIKVLAFIDTGATSSTICSTLVPYRYITKAERPKQSVQFDGTTNIITNIVKNINISFTNTCGEWSPQYNIKQLWVLKLNIQGIKLILGLDFLLSDNGSFTLNKDYLQISKKTTLTPILSEFALEKRGGNNQNDNCENCTCPIPGQCKKINKENELTNTEEKEIEIIKNYEYKRKEFTKDIQLINPREISKLLLTTDDIDHIISKLEKLEIIGEKPLKYWDKDSIQCKLDIINPDLTIKTGSPKYDTWIMEEFKMHIKILTDLNIIRKTDSRHRTAAFIVQKESERKRGQSRMVMNYTRLNDNTHEDGYCIPNKDVLINKIQGSNWFSKFDLKSGFWQVKMHPESIPWTAFTCSEGHYEWLVMPFGLKNAPQIFQRKMDNIFQNCNKYTCVYIDDILIFSKTKQEHISHLYTILKLIEAHGLIISKKKIELLKNNIEFLGAKIGKGTIELQPHITRKILEFPDKIESLKQLQAFLGLVNYARPYIKNLSKYTGPLYNKASPKGNRDFNIEDIKQIQEIKKLAQNLKPLGLPLQTEYLIIETDGSSSGWGGILLSKDNKYGNKSTEKICRYSSGTYKEKGYMTSLDYEILAIIYVLETFKLFIISQKEITVRTDCESIVKYIDNKKEKGTINNRWLKFKHAISNCGTNINWEHIKGKNNFLPDQLSRLLK